MNRRSFFGRVGGLVAGLCGLSAVKAAPAELRAKLDACYFEAAKVRAQLTVDHDAIADRIREQFRGIKPDEPIILDGLIEDVRQVSSKPREMEYLT